MTSYDLHLKILTYMMNMREIVIPIMNNGIVTNTTTRSHMCNVNRQIERDAEHVYDASRV